jgi:hypothetical protein
VLATSAGAAVKYSFFARGRRLVGGGGKRGKGTNGSHGCWLVSKRQQGGRGEATLATAEVGESTKGKNKEWETTTEAAMAASELGS